MNTYDTLRKEYIERRDKPTEQIQQEVKDYVNEVMGTGENKGLPHMLRVQVI